MLFGTVIDTILFFSGSFVYAGAYSNELLIAPLWITAMWAGFAATVNHSMSWLKDKWASDGYLWCCIWASCFYTGEKFGAIDFSLSLLYSNDHCICLWCCNAWYLLFKWISWFR